MAKGKRSNSPKRSRRGGRRSPKKGKVQKAISKNESELPKLHLDAEVEEPDRECELPGEVELEQELAKPDNEVLTAKELLTQTFALFASSPFAEDIIATSMSLSKLPEQQFIFGHVASSLAAHGAFGAEVEKNFAVVWKADESWIRALLAGEVKPAEPEPIEEEAAVLEAEPETVAAAEAVETEAAITEEVMEPVEPAAAIPEQEFVDQHTQEVQMMEAAMPEEVPQVMEAAMPEVPQVMEEAMPEVNKENTVHVFADDVKTVSSKLGEHLAENAATMEGLVPRDVNVAQPLDFA
jgi:hypothetical protein